MSDIIKKQVNQLSESLSLTGNDFFLLDVLSGVNYESKKINIATILSYISGQISSGSQCVTSSNTDPSTVPSALFCAHINTLTKHIWIATGTVSVLDWVDVTATTMTPPAPSNSVVIASVSVTPNTDTIVVNIPTNSFKSHAVRFNALTHNSTTPLQPNDSIFLRFFSGADVQWGISRGKVSSGSTTALLPPSEWCLLGGSNSINENNLTPNQPHFAGFEISLNNSYGTTYRPIHSGYQGVSNGVQTSSTALSYYNRIPSASKPSGLDGLPYPSDLNQGATNSQWLFLSSQGTGAETHPSFLISDKNITKLEVSLGRIIGTSAAPWSTVTKFNLVSGVVEVIGLY